MFASSRKHENIPLMGLAKLQKLTECVVAAAAAAADDDDVTSVDAA